MRVSGGGAIKSNEKFADVEFVTGSLLELLLQIKFQSERFDTIVINLV